MNYAVIDYNGGQFNIHSEHGPNLIAAKASFDNWCAALWNDDGAVDAVVKIVDSNLDEVDGFYQVIQHPAKEI